MSFLSKLKGREHNMTRKLSNLFYVKNQERMSLLPLKRLQNYIFNYSIDPYQDFTQTLSLKTFDVNGYYGQ